MICSVVEVAPRQLSFRVLLWLHNRRVLTSIEPPILIRLIALELLRRVLSERWMPYVVIRLHVVENHVMDSGK